MCAYLILIGIVSDPETGIVLDSFEFRTANNLQFTVISEDPASVAALRESFAQSSKKSHVKRSLATQFGKGVFSAIKMPWRFTKVMVLSLEKVKFKSIISPFTHSKNLSIDR